MTKLLAFAVAVALGGLEAGAGAGALRVCPGPMPVPVDTFVAECKTAGRRPGERCGTPVAPDACSALIQTALARGQITSDAAAWLPRNGFCPITVSALPALLDICPNGAGARPCPIAIPAPADAFDTMCKTAGRDVAQRCAAAIPPELCDSLIQTALANHLLTPDAVEVLQGNGFCPVLSGGAILDFCPVGCFAADTPILTGIADDAEPRYTPAAQLLPTDPVMALSDEAGLDVVDLVARAVGRVVHGPEDPALFVFALANGATLRVTSHHPMVLDTGVITEAAAVTPGAAFIGVDGQRVTVTAITREPATGDVFNFQTNADSQLGHVVAAASVLIGDLALQNELATEQNAIELRR